MIKDFSKLDLPFEINPLYEADGYKVGHPNMLAPDTNREYWTWIPRNLKYMPKGITEIMSVGQQITVRYIHSQFAKNFFFTEERNKSKAYEMSGGTEVSKIVDTEALMRKALKFVEDMSLYLGMEYNGTHFERLWKLGYLPIEIQALPEGLLTKPNIPHMAGINTEDGYAWLGLYLETMFSKLSWQTPTAATIGFEFKKNAVAWAEKTDSENVAFADFMCHDFHSRGGNPFTSIAVGLGHAMSNLGSDTLNVIPAARYYYDEPENEVSIYSVNASEHSVTCTGIFYFERLLKEGKLNDRIAQYYSFDAPCDGSFENPDYLAIAEMLNLESWLIKFPKGILSVVSDTFDLWKLITFILPRLKDLIMSRDGKLVIRPDSGNPVDILCGTGLVEALHGGQPDFDWANSHSQKLTPSEKGVVQLLHEIFGGTISKEGYIKLDSHIGAIYGDSINLERQIAIYERLAAKNYAATNVALGIGLI